MAFTAAARAMAFYNHGRKHFNRRGWLKADRLDTSSDLSGKVFVVTGSNSGLGKCLADHLFSRGARVYMLCRSQERAEAARREILEQQAARDEDNLRLVIADCSLYDEMKRAAQELQQREQHVDGLLCNAGAMFKDKRMTDDGVEATFAIHFLCGTYLLSKFLLPLLDRSDDPRIVIQTSGGMYNSKLHSFAELKDGPSDKQYDGQLAYAKAKRAQVALAEYWAQHRLGKVKVVSSHPGWAHTPGVDDAYGAVGKWMLSPLRSVWEGAEGMAWLAGAPGTDLESGQLYLDGKTQPKHLHKSTETGPEVTDAFMRDLEEFEKALVQRKEGTGGSSSGGGENGGENGAVTADEVVAVQKN